MLSFALLYGGMEVWRLRKPEAPVLYRRVGHVAVVGGAPLTAREHLREVIRRIPAHCRDWKPHRHVTNRRHSVPPYQKRHKLAIGVTRHSARYSTFSATYQGNRRRDVKAPSLPLGI